MNRRCLIFSLIIFFATACSSQQIAIIPQPVHVQTTKGSFLLSKKTVIAANDEDDRKTARIFNDYLRQVYGFTLDIDKQEGKNYIRLTTKKFIKAPDQDAYTLNVTKECVLIEGDTYARTF